MHKRTTFAFIFVSTLLIVKGFSQGFNTGCYFGVINYNFMGTSNINTDPTLPFFTKATNTNAVAFTLGLNLKYDFPIYKFNRELALGMATDLGFGFQGSPNLPGLSAALMLDFPEYVTIRYGNRATPDSREEMGYALGLGYDYTWTALPYQSPSIMAEVGFYRLILRFSFNLLKYTYYYNYTSEGLSPAATMRPFALELSYQLKH